MTETFQQETVFPSLTSAAASNEEVVWTCPFFHTHGTPPNANSSHIRVTDLDANATSLCAFEICPMEVYSVNFTHCQNVGEGSGHVVLFSYADDEMLAQLTCGDSMLYLDNAGYASCRLITVYQTCLLPEGSNPSGTLSSCEGQVSIRGERMNTVDITFPLVQFQVGDLISFNISRLTANDGYLSSLQTGDSVANPASISTSLIVALYQSNLLAAQSACHYYSVAQGGLIDYLDKVVWDGREGTLSLPDYSISEFGSTYKVILWAHSPSKGVSQLAESVEVSVQGSVLMHLEVDSSMRGEHITGSWDFGSQAVQSLPGDVIALYEIDGNGELIFISLNFMSEANNIYSLILITSHDLVFLICVQTTHVSNSGLSCIPYREMQLPY